MQNIRHMVCLSDVKWIKYKLHYWPLYSSDMFIPVEDFRKMS